MNHLRPCYALSLVAFLSTAVAAAEPMNVVVRQNTGRDATADFSFQYLPSPESEDFAKDASLRLLAGRPDPNGGELTQLNDGKLPETGDQPQRNFFFQAGTDGGKILVDLGTTAQIDQINTYSWHPTSRGPQVYVLYAASEADPMSVGWSKIANVDTRPSRGERGGQYGVSIFSTRQSIGRFRYLLFEVSSTDRDDPFGNTFFSEIDVIGTPVGTGRDLASGDGAVYEFVIEDGNYQVTIDTTETPDLTEWANTQLAEVVRSWYPKIVRLLPSEGFEAPQEFSITFNETDRGVAYCSGTRIVCSSGWFRRNLTGEAKGSVVHEMVHVVQQYRGRRRQGRGDPNALRTPGWLQEGIPDFIRWFLYEPESRGAEINPRNVENARFDGNYRISANFLNWVTRKYGFDLIATINGQLRNREYTGDIWKASTGHDVEALGLMWRTAMEEAIKSGPEALREENKPFEFANGEPRP